MAAYRRLVSEFPESRFAPPARFAIVALYDARGRPGATITTLEELVARYPGARESIHGHLYIAYIAALQADRAPWAEAASTPGSNRPHVCRSRRGVCAQGIRRPRAAAVRLRGGVTLGRGGGGARASRIADSYIAMAHHYRGEPMYRRFSQAQTRSGDGEMVADLEAKRTLAAGV